MYSLISNASHLKEHIIAHLSHQKISSYKLKCLVWGLKLCVIMWGMGLHLLSFLDFVDGMGIGKHSCEVVCFLVIACIYCVHMRCGPCLC